MSEIGRVDSAILLLKERLRRLGERKSGAEQTSLVRAQPKAEARLEPLRALARQRGIAKRDLRRAIVRNLLSESMGDELTATLEFESVAERITALLESEDEGRAMIDRALAELD